LCNAVNIIGYTTVSIFNKVYLCAAMLMEYFQFVPLSALTPNLECFNFEACTESTNFSKYFGCKKAPTKTPILEHFR